MNSLGLEKLEFTRILQDAASYATTHAGRRLVLGLLPAVTREEARLLEEETVHSALLAEGGVVPSFSGADRAGEASEELHGGAIALDPPLLRGIGVFLEELVVFRELCSAHRDEFPGVMHGYADELPSLHGLSRKLLKITTPDGELSPSASPELKRLSRRIERLRASLSARLSSICSSFAGTGILRDSPPTMRAGRFVIPVAAARKASVKGIVHDRSDSGATLYIEPSGLVEAGNDLQEAAMDLEQERRRILREATLEVREQLSRIDDALTKAAALDAIFARALYHLRERTVFPQEGPMDLQGLVHPLLPSKTAVRSRMKLENNWKVLVVSGPNAGGKSVLLKAVALASACSRAGLGAHAENPSSMPFFSSVMVSMGDNQSIAMHLSTYSARLSEQRRILEQGNEETLAIIDEPAGGTDPVTGAALSAVFLQKIADLGVRAIVSTHMGQLKLLAMEKTGFVNGSMSFNPETLTPGYEFIPDIPGASCTLEAAAIAGFPEELLLSAAGLAGDSFSLDSLVVSLRELEETRNREVEELSREREAAGEEARRLRAELEDRGRKLDETLRQAEEEKADKLRSIQSRADSLLATMADAPARESRLRARKELSRLARNEIVTPSTRENRKTGAAAVELKPGDTVKVTGWGDTGTVEKVSRSTAMVRIGPMLLKKELSELEPVDSPGDTPVSISDYSTPVESPESILLGLTVDEAVAELDIKLDNCIASGLRRLRVVHGKGRLMKGVTDWLRRDRRIRKVAMAPPEEGGAGASIVTIKG